MWTWNINIIKSLFTTRLCNFRAKESCVDVRFRTHFGVIILASRTFPINRVRMIYDVSLSLLLWDFHFNYCTFANLRAISVPLKIYFIKAKSEELSVSNLELSEFETEKRKLLKIPEETSQVKEILSWDSWLTNLSGRASAATFSI